MLPGWGWAREQATVEVGGTRSVLKKPTFREFYVPRFKQLQVLAVGNDWVLVQRAGKKWLLSNNEFVGPRRLFFVRMEGDKLVLFDRYRQLPLADIDLRTADGPNAAVAVTIRDTSMDTLHTPTSRSPVMSALLAADTGANGSTTPNEAFPDIRPPQVMLYDTPLGNALRFLLRDTPALSLDISAEDAEALIDSFRVHGPLSMVVKNLAGKTGMFIGRQGSRVVVGKSPVDRINDGANKPLASSGFALTPSGLVIEAGDPLASVFMRLGARDQSIYILAEGADLRLPGRSAPIHSLSDLVAYLRAYGHDVAVSVKDAPYMRVKVSKLQEGPALTADQPTAQTQGCAPLASIRVGSARFRDNSLAEVMNTLLAETGWSWHATATQTLPKAKITAVNISDSLDSALHQLLGQLGISYGVRDCRIIIGLPTADRSVN
jgi:hypothetical protein